MVVPIDAFRSWLNNQYQTLGLDLLEARNGYDENNAVVIYVDEDLSSVEGPSKNALILDPQVGIALFMLTFDSEVDIRAQLARAIRYRTQLLRRRLDKDKSDERGGWRVVLHWFVDEKDRFNWIESAARMRRETAHLEELPIDAIFCKDSKWNIAIEEHGIPRLMFRTRQVLGMQSDTDVLSWSSADSRVRKVIEGFSGEFKDELGKEYANKVEQWVLQHKDSPNVGKKSTCIFKEFVEHFSVRNFRNIESFEIRFNPNKVQAAVIHGPNGTGKSNLFEALEIAICGCSGKAEKFIGDKDVTKTRKLKEYLERYIKPIQDSEAETYIEINEKERSILVDNNGEDINEASELQTNFLTQEDSRDFAYYNATELASKILGEFSDLAYQITSYSEGELNKARAGQNSLLDNLGLTRQVKRTETAYKKITNQFLVDAVAQPRSLTDWLSNPALEFSPTTANSRKYATAMLDLVGRAEGVSNTIHGTLTSNHIEESIDVYLREAWANARSSAAFISHIMNMVESWPSDIGETIQLWGTWLISQRQELADKPAPADLAEKEKSRLEIEKQLEEISKKDRINSEREAHFERLELFLEQTWLNIDPDHCPTCDTDLTDRGGVREAISTTRDINKQNLSELRNNYKENKKKLDVLMKELGDLSKSRCPISDGEQEKIRKIISPHLPDGEDLTSVISDANKQKCLVEWVTSVTRLPVLPIIVSEKQGEERINEVSKKILLTCRDIETSFAAPSAWDRVVKSLRNRLASVLDQHLPNTLGGLWNELVLNMTPARWQMPGNLDFSFENRRGSNHATIDLVSGNSSWLARYILNAAESHILGIAWFFTRYLTQGRFKHSLLVMDDPAQEMDQITYRDLCRLYESLLRLHSVYKLPLSMLLFLHQDERALDAARATGALLYRLNWNRGRSVLAESHYLYSPEHRHPTPSEFLSNTENI